MLNALRKKSSLSADRVKLGRWGEKHCEKFLRKKGLKPLTRNFSCKTGEIDLIMVDTDGTIVFIEVKTRANEDFAAAEYAVTAVKKKRLHRTARWFLQINNITDRPCRFDVVTIVLNKKTREQITHYPEAFLP